MNACIWCGTRYSPRSTGGKPQRFCSPACRRKMDAGLRAIGQQQLENGAITVADLQRALSANASDRGRARDAA